MFKTKKWGLAGSIGTLAASLITGGAYADDTTTNQQDLNQRLQQLQQELDQIKAQQAGTPEQATSANKGVTSNTAGFNGYSISSPDGQYTLSFHTLVQLDGRFNLDAPNNQGLTDTFTLRRVEPSLQGNLTPLFSYVLMPEYGGTPTSTVSADIYGEFHFQPQYFNLRIGKFKEPFSLENLQSAGNLAFIERGYPTNLSPNRDLGVQWSGALGHHNQLTYQLGVFNGAPDGGDGAPTDNDNHKEVALRLFARPWHDGQGGALDNLGFGVAATSGREDGSGAGTNGILPQFRTPAQNIFFQYNANVVANGPHDRLSPQAYYYYGGFSALAEYVISRQDVSLTSKPFTSAAVENKAQELTLGYVLTGEKASYNGVKPAAPYSANGGWGAFELVARAGRLAVDKDAFSSGFASLATNAQEARSAGAGLNWYLNNNVKLVFDYEQTWFSGGAANGANRPLEHALLFRSQYAF